MDTSEMQASGELRLGDLVAILWNAKLLIGVVAAIFLAIGCAMYFVIPPIFMSKVTVRPLLQTEFSGYQALSEEKGVFPYTPATLFSEFSSYAKDVNRLSALAERTGIVERHTDDDEAYSRQLVRFVTGVKFTTPNALEIQGGQQFLNIEVKAGNQTKLETFMQQLLLTTNADMVSALAGEIRKRASDIRDALDSQMTKLKVDIDARRQVAEGARKDDVVRLVEQSTIARLLGIEKPLSLRAVEAAEQGKAPSAQINSFGDNQPDYLQGYAALDERITIIKNRKDSDAFIGDLRELEQQLYVLRNDPRPSYIVTLLERSPLRDPASAVLARFSISSAIAEKVFPRLSVFAGGFLLIGLIFGSLMAFFRR